VTLTAFFRGRNEARAIFEAVREAAAAIGRFDVRCTKSQVAFRRRVGFAYVWLPDMYLDRADVPLVLTIGLRRRDGSPRWKQIVEPAPGRFTHHLELRSPDEVDDEVVAWLREAWEIAA
jgi:hypothetical protein